MALSNGRFALDLDRPSFLEAAWGSREPAVEQTAPRLTPIRRYAMRLRLIAASLTSEGMIIYDPENDRCILCVMAQNLVSLTLAFVMVVFPGVLFVAGVIFLCQKGRYRNAWYLPLYLACGLMAWLCLWGLWVFVFKLPLLWKAQ